MKSMLKLGCCLALAGLLIVALGCPNKPAVPATKGTESKADPSRLTQPPFGEKEGYWHLQSGVGFLYPEGWENLGITSRGPFTSLGLQKGQGEIAVTLFWSVPDGPINAETVGEAEWSALRTVYGDKVGRPEPIVAQAKSGYKLTISGGPLGEGGSEFTGVVYVFAVKAGQDWWKIKLRATVRGKDKLPEVEKMLGNYRW